MIPNFLISGNKNKGSSLMLPANGLGGSRATILFLFSFLKAAAAPALRALKQAGKKEGGWGGKEFLPACAFRAEGAVGAETLGEIQSAKSSGFCSKKVRILTKSRNL